MKTMMTAGLMVGMAGSAFGQGVLPSWFALADGGGPIPTLLFDNNSQRFNMHAWRRDGADKPAVLAVVGWMEVGGVRGSMATWDGARWDLYPEIANGNNFGRSTVFDPDGAGPQPERVFAIRMGAAPSRVVMWNGSAWTSVGALTEPIVSSWGALASFDPDGDGPQPAMLIHGNQRVSAWRGSGAWEDFGLVTSPAPIRITSLQQYDPDGTGPENPVLVAAGYFTSIGGAPAVNVAMLRGIDWEAMPGLTPLSPAGRLSVHDFDGPGPRAAELVVPMRATADSTTTDLWAWGGGAWRPAAQGTFDTVPLVTYPQNTASISAPGVMEGLLAFGQFTSHGGAPTPGVARVDPSTGVLAPLSDRPGAGFTSYVDSVAAVDLDGDGPRPATVFAIGPTQRSNGMAIPGVARWNGREWQPMTGDFQFGASTPYVSALSVVDPDGDGPAGETTYLRGAFTSYAGVEGYNDIAAFDGGHVSPMGGGLGAVLANKGSVVRFDPDAEGPAPARLVASGALLSEWDGAEWASLPLGTSTYEACLHDFDGAGPTPPRLVVGTWVTSGGVLQYDGASLAPLGVTEHLGTNGYVRTLLSHDPDGPGPRLPVLYVGGLAIYGSVLLYDESGWHQVGAGWQGAVRALAAFDPDGDGPRDVEIIGGGTVADVAPGRGAGVSAWNGTQWSRMGTLPGGATVTSLAVLDADGDGPAPAALIAAGWAPGGDPDRGWVRAWDVATQEWTPLGGAASDLAAYAEALAVEHPFGPGGPQRLAVGLRRPADDQGAGAFGAVVRFTALGPAWLTRQPADVTVAPGSVAVLAAEVHRAYAGTTYQWLRDGVPVLGAAGTVTAMGPAADLVITDAHEGDAGLYELRMTNAAGVSSSRQARLIVALPCPADFNGDGFLDFFDYDDFTGCFEAGACPGGRTADFNADGFADFFDYDDFVAAFEAGC